MTSLGPAPELRPGDAEYGMGGGEDDKWLVHSGGAVPQTLQMVGYRPAEGVPVRHGRADRPGGAGAAEADRSLDGLGAVCGDLYSPDGPVFAGSAGPADPHRGHLPARCGSDRGHSRSGSVREL